MDILRSFKRCDANVLSGIHKTICFLSSSSLPCSLYKCCIKLVGGEGINRIVPTNHPVLNVFSHCKVKIKIIKNKLKRSMAYRLVHLTNDSLFGDKIILKSRV